MICMLTGAILNTILDPLFIFSFGWGIKGAAWATVIGQVISGLMVILYFCRFREMDLRREMLRPDFKCFRKIVSLGMASCINQVAMGIVQVTMNNVLRIYGAKSVYGAEIPLACAGVISKVNMVFMAICIGISQGCQPIIGYNYGAKNYARVKETVRTAVTLSLMIGAIFFLCFQVFPRQIIQIFGNGSENFNRKSKIRSHRVFDTAGPLFASADRDLPDLFGDRRRNVCRPHRRRCSRLYCHRTGDPGVAENANGLDAQELFRRIFLPAPAVEPG